MGSLSVLLFPMNVHVNGGCHRAEVASSGDFIDYQVGGNTQQQTSRVEGSTQTINHDCR